MVKWVDLSPVERQLKLDTLAAREARLRIKLLNVQIEKEQDTFDMSSFDLNDVEGTIQLLFKKGFELITSPVGEKLILSGLFTYAWWQAYGKDFSKNDLLLGITYGFTIPPALKGGVLANTYALGALAILGVGFIPDEIWDTIESTVSEAVPGTIKEAVAQATGEAPIPKTSISGRKSFQKP